LQRGIGQFSLPIAALLLGPLVDSLSLLAKKNEWIEHYIFTPLVGSGQGRPAAFLFVALGGLNLLVALAAFLFRPLRRIDLDLPDTVASAPNEHKKSQ